MDKRDRPIGFFDSGVGGISVLREALKIMPNENYIYFGDSKNAPYGIRDFNEVKELTYSAVEFLLGKGAKAIVIACNTATSAAVASLRVTYPKLPIVGIEPAVKPAVKLNSKGKIIIMATPVTLKLSKFHKLIDRYKDNADIVSMPCAGLVEFIESGNTDGEDLKKYLAQKFSDYSNNDVAAVVLGCTHYPFIRRTLSNIIGSDVPIIDGGMGTCREIKRRLEIADLLSKSETKGKIKIYNSLGTEESIELSERLLYSE